MKRILPFVLLAVATACAHLPWEGDARERTQRWDSAHRALTNQDFAAALVEFEALADRHSDAREGREALFYLGSIHLDPRNPRWNPRPAEEALGRYVALAPATVIHRRPEGEILLELARQLNLPGEARVPGLQPETRVVSTPGPTRVIAPAGQVEALRNETIQLRAQLAERDQTIRQQADELERIRRTLRPRTP